MGQHFFDISFTPSVMAEQERHGSRNGYASWSASGGPALNDASFGPEEASFIAARDGFYIATVSETGWPYVQFRGGPAGFVRVLDGTMLAWADFRGNRQYVTTGNAAGDRRIALFFMDYRSQRRLKVFGYLTVRELGGPDVPTSGLAVPGYRARVDHEFRVQAAGYDWNCPQHITQRFTAAEVEQAVAPLRHRIDLLQQRLAKAGLHQLGPEELFSSGGEARERSD